LDPDALPAAVVVSTIVVLASGVVVSLKYKRAVAVAPVGTLLDTKVTVTESRVSKRALTVTVAAVEESVPPPTLDKVAVPLVPETVMFETACDGATESIPRPNAAIAVKATRLKNVFFDITFLSFVVDKTFLTTADRD